MAYLGVGRNSSPTEGGRLRFGSGTIGHFLPSRWLDPTASDPCPTTIYTDTWGSNEPWLKNGLSSLPLTRTNGTTFPIPGWRSTSQSIFSRLFISDGRGYFNPCGQKNFGKGTCIPSGDFWPWRTPTALKSYFINELKLGSIREWLRLKRNIYIKLK